MKNVGRFVLDTLQIYFPWDDDFYTFLKQKGFGQGGLKKKTLPLIYTDVCSKSTGNSTLRRKYVIDPKFFGKKHSEIGWTKTEKDSQPIIPSERPLIDISVKDNRHIVFKIISQVNGKEQYHLEYSSMAAFGKIYSNWVNVYLSIEELKKLVNNLKKDLEKVKNNNTILETESKQAQREEIDYVSVPIIYYEFSIGEFKYAKDFLKLNGYKGKSIPSLVFDSKDRRSNKLMSPIAKVGILHTTGEDGFMVRMPQFVIKISQNKITTSKRGKKAKVKGLIVDANNENVFILDYKMFLQALSKLVQIFEEKHKNINLN